MWVGSPSGFTTPADVAASLAGPRPPQSGAGSLPTTRSPPLHSVLKPQGGEALACRDPIALEREGMLVVAHEHELSMPCLTLAASRLCYTSRASNVKRQLALPLDNLPQCLASSISVTSPQSTHPLYFLPSLSGACPSGPPPPCQGKGRSQRQRVTEQ